MIEFKNGSNDLLPYNTEKYFDFLDDDCDLLSNWNAISFQIIGSDERKIDINNVDIFETLFKNIILELDNNHPWVINHYFKDFNWFPNEEDNLTSLRALFKKNNIQNTFKGSLIFMMDDLFKYAKDLILYPYILSYRDLDISHSELPFIIKITNHLTIELFSTDKILLRKIVKGNSLSSFNVKEYRGSAIWS